MSTNCKDDGYQSEGLGWAHAYLFPHLQAMLGQTRGAVLDLGCGNGVIPRALITAGTTSMALMPRSQVLRLQMANHLAVYSFSTLRQGNCH